MIATRHRITHGYFDVDLDTLWEIVTVALPAVLSDIKAILASLDGAP